MWRPVHLIAVFAGLSLSAAGLCAAERTDPKGHVVCLTCREPDRIEGRGFPPPLLVRELVRQAFLIAARDECGLSTRDATLREEFPSAPDPRDVPFDMYSSTAMPKKGVNYSYALGRKGDKTAKKLWTWEFHVDFPAAVLFTIKKPESITALTIKAEALSRGEFKDLLKREGWGQVVPSPRRSAQVPRQAGDDIWTWNEFALLGGLRRIHAEIGTKGESPELLAALAIGYANLGMVTEHYYSAASKAYFARGLLYAERLMQKTDQSPWALWHRAYVRVAVGLDQLAQADVAAAKTPSQPASDRPLPFFAKVLPNYLDGKLSRMLAQAKDPVELRLAHYLAFETTQLLDVEDNSLRVAAARPVVRDCPDCFSALEGLSATYALSVMREVTESSFQQMSKSLRKRLPGLPGLPESLAKEIKEHQPHNDLAEEIEFRIAFIDALKKAAKTGGDRMEPSLGAVAQSIEEVEFKQVMRRLELERFVFGASADETIAAYRNLCERHPYGGFVDFFSTSRLDVLKGIATLLPQIDSAELVCIEARPLRLGENYVPGRLNHWLQIVYCHADPVLRDEIVCMVQGAAGNVEQSNFNAPYMAMLAGTSSKSPVAVAFQIARNWGAMKSRAAELEAEYADDPVVQGALTKKYRELKKYTDAERCALRRIQIAPDYTGYDTLAAIYKDQGDLGRWKTTLQESLSLPSLGLEEFSIRNRIAWYYMERQEWNEALPYAEGAAASYSAWGLKTLARCHEMLGHWQKAEELMRATAERYEDSAFDWMLWCFRTGHGDVPAATECARKHFESLGSAATQPQLDLIATFYLLQDQPEKALVIFEKGYDRAKGVFDAMQAAMIADELGKQEERDRNLKRVVTAGLRAKPKEAQGLYGRLGALMKTALPPGSMKDFDFEKLDVILRESKTKAWSVETNLAYFAGMFLKNRGNAEKARVYLVRAAETAQYHVANQTLACRQLRQMKIPFVPLGGEKARH
ncbi:MAG TPA: hypothetical protein VHX68_16300 [Planctomycetaceae bacterium]|jgi:tetratricopeptide (TPR) repeat protein|nr:hypothetical protein [Planctomycetaceae bacterium]